MTSHSAMWTCTACGRRGTTKVINTTRRNPMCYPCLDDLDKANRRDRTKPGPFHAAAVSTAAERLQQRLKGYGLTQGDFDALVEAQDGCCALCRARPANPKDLVVDHNHANGVVRGLLCGRCNTALGMFGDDPEMLRKAATYLDERGSYAGITRPVPAPRRSGTWVAR